MESQQSPVKVTSYKDSYTCLKHQLRELTVHLLPNMSHHCNTLIRVTYVTCEQF